MLYSISMRIVEENINFLLKKTMDAKKMIEE